MPWRCPSARRSSTRSWRPRASPCSTARAVWARPSSPSASRGPPPRTRSEEHTSELQSHVNLVCRLLLEKKKQFPSSSLTSFFFFTCLILLFALTCATYYYPLLVHNYSQSIRCHRFFN